MGWPMRFCPDCGVALAASAEPHHAVCEACGAHHWRNAKPCAGALIVRDGRVLLARRAVDPRRGAWDVVGGFLEPDEDPAEGARREVAEETGLTARLTRLLGFFPDTYGDDGTYTLNIYFEADVGDDVPVARSDVAELAWFAPDELPEDLAFPHEHALLARWRRWTAAP